MIDTNIVFDYTATNDMKFRTFQSKYFEIINCVTEYGYTDELNRDIYAVLNIMYPFLGTLEDGAGGFGQEKTRQLKSLSNSYYQALMNLYTEKKVGFCPHAHLCSLLGQIVCKELVNSSWFVDIFGIDTEQKLSVYYFEDKVGFLEKQRRQKVLKSIGLTIEQFTNFVKLSRDYGYNINRIVTKQNSDATFIRLATLSLSVISNCYDSEGNFTQGWISNMDSLMDYSKTV